MDPDRQHQLDELKADMTALRENQRLINHTLAKSNNPQSDLEAYAPDDTNDVRKGSVETEVSSLVSAYKRAVIKEAFSLIFIAISTWMAYLVSAYLLPPDALDSSLAGVFAPLAMGLLSIRSLQLLWTITR